MKRTNTKTSGKIFGIGFHRTGTTSLAQALKILGYKVKGETPRALIPILRKRTRKIKKIIDPYDALEDAPWFLMFRQLDKLYPGSKFILTHRDPEKWHGSAVSRFYNYLRVPNILIYGYSNRYLTDKAASLKRYISHNASVLEYFGDRPEDILLIDLSKGMNWDSLCRFLGHEIPDQSFPHANKTGSDQQKTAWFKLIRKRVKAYFKSKYISLLGLWPDDENAFFKSDWP